MFSRILLVAVAVSTPAMAACSVSGMGESLPSSAFSAPTGGVRIKEFADLPRGGYSSRFYPAAVAAGPDGLMWVADSQDLGSGFGPSAVVAVTTSGSRQHVYRYNSAHASFSDIVEGPDDALWITDYFDGRILRLTAHGKYTSFQLPNDGVPMAIVNGPEKALWFSADNRGSGPVVGRITTDGRIKEYSAPVGWDIAAGSDGALWIADPDGSIGRITTRGKVTVYSKGISYGESPISIAAGPDGALWFTEQWFTEQGETGWIGRITTSGKITQYGVAPDEQPQDLAVGPDGAMWFTEYENCDLVSCSQVRTRGPKGSPNSYVYASASKIGRITMQHSITVYSKGVTANSAPTGIAAGPDGAMWFVESFSDKTGRVTL